MRTSRYLFVGALLIALAVLGGCSFLNGIFGSGAPDLVVKSAEFTYSSDGVTATGVHVVIANIGDGDASGTEYALLLSSDSVADPNADTVFYRADLSLGAGQELDTMLSGNDDIGPWIQNNGVEMPGDARFYFGVAVDPKRTLQEDNENNNNLMSKSSMWWIDGRPFKYALKLNVTFPLRLGYIDVDTTTSGSVSTGTHALYVALQPVNAQQPDLTPDSNGVVLIPDNLSWNDVPGVVRKLDVDYDYTTGGASGDFYVGVPDAGDYQLYYLMDGNDDGRIAMQIDMNNPPTYDFPFYLDPWGYYRTNNPGNPPDPGIPPDPFHISGDMTLPEAGYPALELQSGNAVPVPGAA